MDKLAVLLGILTGLGFGYGYGLRESSKIFARLNERATTECDKAMTTIAGLRENIEILKSVDCRDDSHNGGE